MAVRIKEHQGNSVLHNDRTILRLQRVAILARKLWIKDYRQSWLRHNAVSGRSVAEATLRRSPDQSDPRIWDELDALLHELGH